MPYFNNDHIQKFTEVVMIGDILCYFVSVYLHHIKQIIIKTHEQIAKLYSNMGQTMSFFFKYEYKIEINIFIFCDRISQQKDTYI